MEGRRGLQLLSYLGETNTAFDARRSMGRTDGRMTNMNALGLDSAPRLGEIYKPRLKGSVLSFRVLLWVEG
jgi:hypothetical protein